MGNTGSHGLSGQTGQIGRVTEIRIENKQMCHVEM